VWCFQGRSGSESTELEDEIVFGFLGFFLFQQQNNNNNQKGLRPGMVAHACNPSYSRSVGRKIVVQGWPRQKEKRYYLKKNSSKQK
jgi:hypothetical protein